MEYFVIEGGRPLNGTITPVGNKNAALPLLAASLLTDEPLYLRNVPDIGDVRTKIELLTRMGVVVAPDGEHSLMVQASGVGASEPDWELSRRIRTAPLLAGPLLARRGFVTIGRPGGDRIGRRRLDTHWLALQALGAHIELGSDRFTLRADRLRGCSLFLDEMSVTGTEQAILAAVLAEGTTTISNAASEPHVQDVCRCLNAMGASISGIGTNSLVIEGVRRLHSATYTIGPDYMEVGSLIGSGSSDEIKPAHCQCATRRASHDAHRLWAAWCPLE